MTKMISHAQNWMATVPGEKPGGQKMKMIENSGELPRPC
jgi:hypothetical protein